MTTDLVTVKPEDSLKKIEQIFSKNSFHHLPVVAIQANLMGIISKQDTCKLYQNLSKRTTGKTWTEKELNALIPLLTL